MTTITQTKSGFGFLGFAAIMVAAVLIISMGTGALVMRVAEAPEPKPVAVEAPIGYYSDAELEAVATTKMIVLDLPGEGATEVAIGHIATKHGTEAVQAVRTGGWKNGNCNGGRKTYAYKLADDGRYWLRVSWQGKVVTCFKATWEYLVYCFKVDNCDPPHPPSHHDLMSSPAY